MASPAPAWDWRQRRHMDPPRVPAWPPCRLPPCSPRPPAAPFSVPSFRRAPRGWPRSCCGHAAPPVLDNVAACQRAVLGEWTLREKPLAAHLAVYSQYGVDLTVDPGPAPLAVVGSAVCVLRKGAPAQPARGHLRTFCPERSARGSAAVTSDRRICAPPHAPWPCGRPIAPLIGPATWRASRGRPCTGAATLR